MEYRPCSKRFLLSVSLVAVLAGPCQYASGQSASGENLLAAGNAAMRKGDLLEAEHDFAAYVAAAPSSAEGHFNLGLVKLQQKKLDDSIAELKKSIALKPRMRGAHLFLGIGLYRLDQLSAASAALEEEVRISPSDPVAWMWLGVSELAEGHNKKAAASLDKAAELNPKDVDILYHQGRAHMLVSKETYEEMYKVAPDSWRTHQVLAQSFAEADRPQDAISECNKALELRPNEPGLHQQLGDVYWSQNDLAKAKEEFLAEMRIDPYNVDVKFKLAVVSLERSEMDEARQLLTDVLRAQPNFAAAHYQLGRVEAQLQNNDKAANEFLAAIHDAGDAPDTEIVKQSYYGLALAYRRLQRTEEARAAMDSFTRLKQQAEAEQSQKLQNKLKRADHEKEKSTTND
jgi:tetratricopeptide (TPR) repeat protein